jgi:hypothetical protein
MNKFKINKIERIHIVFFIILLLIAIVTAYKFISYILSNYAVDKVLATVKDIYSYLSQRNTKLSQEFHKKALCCVSAANQYHN